MPQFQPKIKFADGIPQSKSGSDGELKLGLHKGVLNLYAKYKNKWHAVSFSDINVEKTLALRNVSVKDVTLVTQSVNSLVVDSIRINGNLIDSTGNTVTASSIINHANDTTQAHPDYLLNTGEDIMEGSLLIKGGTSSGASASHLLHLSTYTGSLDSFFVGNTDYTSGGSITYNKKAGFWISPGSILGRLHVGTDASQDFVVLDSGEVKGESFFGASYVNTPSYKIGGVTIIDSNKDMDLGTGTISAASIDTGQGQNDVHDLQTSFDNSGTVENVSGNHQGSAALKFKVGTSKITNTELEYNTGQHLSTTDSPQFGLLGVGAPATSMGFSTLKVYSSSRDEHIRLESSGASNGQYSTIGNDNLGNFTLNGVGYNNTGGNVHVTSTGGLAGIMLEGYTSGFGGAGWGITKDVSTGEYTLGVDNIVVRNSMSIHELLINQIRTTNGSLLVGSSAIVKTVTLESGGTYNGKYKLTLESSDDGSAADNTFVNMPFKVGDLILCQKYSGAGASSSPPYNLLFKAQLEVTDSHYSHSSIPADVIYCKKDDTGTPDASSQGDDPASWTTPGPYTFARVGSSSDTARQGTIYLTSDEANSPHISIWDNIDSWGDWLTTDSAALKVRIGDVTGVSSMTGYGMYAQNVKLTGNITANSGYIGTGGSFGGWEITASGLKNATSNANTKIEIGTGGHGHADQAFFVDGYGNFSLGDKLVYTGSTGALTIEGTITLTGGITASSISDGAAVFGTAGADLQSLSTLNADTISGGTTGLYMDANNLGYVSSGTYKTYMANNGDFFLGGSSVPSTESHGWLSWDHSSNDLKVHGTVNVQGGNVFDIANGNSLIPGTACTDLNLWTFPTTSGTWSVVDVTDGTQGDKCLQITDSTTSSSGNPTSNPFYDPSINTGGIPCNENHTYKVSVSARMTTSSGDQRNYFLVRFYNAAGSNLNPSNPQGKGWLGEGDYYYWGVSNQILPTSWTDYEATFGPGGQYGIPTGAVTMAVGGLMCRDKAPGESGGETTTTVQIQNYRLERLEVASGTTIHGGGIVMSSGGVIQTYGKNAYDNTTAGIWLGYDSTATKYRLGIGDATNSLTYDGAGNLSVTGAVNATSGNFGGYVTAGGMRVGKEVQTGKDGIWVGTYNYWYDDGSFRIGDASRFLKTDSSGVVSINCDTLKINGSASISTPADVMTYINTDSSGVQISGDNVEINGSTTFTNVDIDTSGGYNWTTVWSYKFAGPDNTDANTDMENAAGLYNFYDSTNPSTTTKYSTSPEGAKVLGYQKWDCSGGNATSISADEKYKRNRIAFDNNALYRISCRVRGDGANDCAFTLGVMGFDADNDTYVNYQGSNFVVNQHRIAALDKNLNGTYETITGYFKGSSNPGDDSLHNLASDPAKLHINVKYISPHLQFNNNDTDESEASYIDWIKIEKVSGATTIDADAITTGKIKADRIDVTDVFSESITASGTITGGTISGSTITGSTINAGTLTAGKTYLNSSTPSDGTTDFIKMAYNLQDSDTIPLAESSYLKFDGTIAQGASICIMGTGFLQGASGSFNYFRYEISTDGGTSWKPFGDPLTMAGFESGQIARETSSNGAFSHTHDSYDRDRIWGFPCPLNFVFKEGVSKELTGADFSGEGSAISVATTGDNAYSVWIRMNCNTSDEFTGFNLQAVVYNMS